MTVFKADVKDLLQLFGAFLNRFRIFVVKVSRFFSRFKPAIVKEFIHDIVRERLSGVKYEAEKIPELCSSLAECIRDKVKSKYSNTFCIIFIYLFLEH